jgi:hypothetical protein
MLEFLKQWGTLVVALAALAQPWLLALWRWLFRQGTVDVYQTGTIEVGYSSFGATIGLHDTLRAGHRDHFIRSIELTVTKQKDSSKHHFEWGVFRTQKLTVSGTQEASVELPYGFMLTTTQPHRYNIQFFDNSLQAEIRPHVTTVGKEWAEAVGQLPSLGVGFAPVQAAHQQAVQDLWQEFSKKRLLLEAYTTIDRLCYWESGRYFLEMRANTASPNRTFTRCWFFELSEEEVKSIRLNTVKLLQDVCGRVYGQYNFAWAKYQEPA